MRKINTKLRNLIRRINYANKQLERLGVEETNPFILSKLVTNKNIREMSQELKIARARKILQLSENFLIQA
ncbi:hypothetical protein MF1_01560 [Bartonella quintana]|nr:hypothetical protein MF1_01560 [Bartonella quintana]